MQKDEAPGADRFINDVTPPHTELRGIYKKSYAYDTLRNRLPRILTVLIEYLQDEKLREELNESENFEMGFVVEKIARLQESLESDGTLEYFEGRVADKESWNRFLSEIPMPMRTFYQVCWLHAECYMYRRICSFFENSTALQNFDYFRQQKAISLEQAKPAIEQIAANLNTKNNCDYFAKILRLCLWSNRCDLSLTSGCTVRPIDNLLDSAHIFDAQILVDDSMAIWQCIEGDPQGTAIIDFVCDNAGFELFSDLLLADYFLEHNFAVKVRFHIKAIPWFISDTIASDVDSLLEMLCGASEPHLNKLGDAWREHLQSGKFQLIDTFRFWTSPFEYFRMPLLDPDLFNFLSEARLVIFKGDLNYRKLLGDFNWNPTDEFQKTLRGFAPTDLCALRTVKCDLISGLSKGLVERVSHIKPDWMKTGEYGLIQFAKQ